MCGRYFVEPREGMMELGELIARILQREDALVKQMKLGEIFPTDVAPVIAADRSGMPQPLPMKWGFLRYDNRSVVINARSETAMGKPIFQNSMMERRCLIPALHYFEWDKKGKDRIKYKIRPQGQEMITLAGIHRYDKHLGAPVFVILTRAASESIRYIHDRMPVIIPKDVRGEWLQGSGDIDVLLRKAELDMNVENAAS